MRVCPPVPFNARVANQDTSLPFGGGMNGSSSVRVRKGQKVIFSTWATHRSKAIFGEDALEFRPERWETLKGDSTLGFIPFNSGPRACPGRKCSNLFFLSSHLPYLRPFSVVGFASCVFLFQDTLRFPEK